MKNENEIRERLRTIQDRRKTQPEKWHMVGWFGQYNYDGERIIIDIAQETVLKWILGEETKRE